jgi:pyruvate kinase
MERLIQNGMDIARVNFSHGSYEQHKETIYNLKEAREKCKAPLAIMLDTRGPEIRTGLIAGGGIAVSPGSRLILVPEGEEAEGTIAIRPSIVLKSLEVGTLLLIDNGYIQATVVERTDEGVVVEFLNSGVVLSSKGINIPSVQVSLPSLTEKDIADITFGCQEGVEIIAASFIRRADNVLDIKRLLSGLGRSEILLLAKIESAEGVQNFESILHVADGIMVARGDLGVEVPISQVPKLQKMMIKKCNLIGKPVVTATQMLESMMSNPRPTRAEVSDVANAIYDGTSALMLSGETAVGKYPIESVETMKSVSIETEEDFNYNAFFDLHATRSYHDIPSALTLSAVKTASSLDAKAIFTFTHGGATARLLSRLKPQMPIIGFTTDLCTYHQLSLLWGVLPVMCEKGCSPIDEAFSYASDWALKHNLVSYGDLVVVTAGFPFWVSGTSNTILVKSIGDVLARGSKGVGSRVHGPVLLVPGPSVAKSGSAHGAIVVLTTFSNDLLPLVLESAGVILQSFPENGESEERLFQVCREEGKPVIIGVDDAFRTLRETQLITIDPEKAIVYKGIVN